MRSYRSDSRGSMGPPVITLTTAMVLAVVIHSTAFAQHSRPASPAGNSAVEVGGRYDVREGYGGGGWIEVKYGRPIRRGRSLFAPADYADALNDGAPVWRAGANVSTRLSTEVPIGMGGTTIPPGEYTLFIDLHAEPWTFIVSTWPVLTEIDASWPGDEDKIEALFGAYYYTLDRDLLRVPMTVTTLQHSFEQLSWQFLDVTESGGTLAMLWETTMASVSFTLERQP